MSTIDTGTVLDLGKARESVSRRRFLRVLGAAGSGIAGLTTTIETVYGASPDGVPIPYTSDRNGNPDKVRVIPEERYRRIRVFRNLPLERILGLHEAFIGLTMEQLSSDETVLALKVLLTDNSTAVTQRLPDAISGVPVTHEVEDSTAHADAFEGGDQVERSDGGYGTATMVATDSSSRDDVILTADHVMEGESTMYDSGGDSIGNFNARDQDHDITSYTADSGLYTDPGGTVQSIPDISGAWFFSGLTDAVGTTDDGGSVSDGGTVSVKMYGNGTGGVVENECNNTKRYGNHVDHQADMANRNATGGDSGGPWVDSNGKFLAMHSG